MLNPNLNEKFESVSGVICMTNTMRFVPCGDRSLLLYLGDEIDPGLNERVHALANTLRQKRHPAVVEVTPSYHCLLIEYDPIRLRMDQLEELIRSAAEDPAQSALTPRTVEIPICYGGEHGPDLETVAAQSGFSADEVIHRHIEPLYRVYGLGFSPGFPYLGGLDPAIATPRLAEPRVRIPGGSVGIGGNQTGIYPGAGPGGWQIIGQTPTHLFDPHRQPPCLLEPGVSVRFVPIDEVRYGELAVASATAEPVLPSYAEGKTGLRILQPGLSTTIQDLGRRGFMGCGVPLAGAVDFRSLMVGNWLLGNRARTAALEITVSGPEVEFTGPIAFCVTGAPIPAELIPAGGGSPIPVSGWTTQLAGPGDRLRLGTASAGCRSYLCVAGGIDLPPVLGSLSEDLFAHVGPLGRPVRAGDWLPLGLPIHPPADLAGRSLPADSVPTFGGEAIIRAVRGPQAEAFTDEAVAAFFGSEYRVGSQSDRQGLRLEGPALALAHAHGADILSEPIPHGSIQVPANGQPILLMGNRQTTGGYTKIAVAVYNDLAAASQLRPGDRLRFAEVDLAEAHAIAWAERRNLAQIRRQLERDIRSQAVQEVRILAAAPARSEAPAEVIPQAPVDGAEPEKRLFRITIGGVEYNAEVEEVLE